MVVKSSRYHWVIRYAHWRLWSSFASPGRPRWLSLGTTPRPSSATAFHDRCRCHIAP